MTDFVRILFVEDNEERIALFQRWLPSSCVAVFIRSGGRALKVIEMDGEREYAGICLDYDLNEQMLSSEREVKGIDVVRKLVRVVPRTVPVLVHSMNPAGSRKMVGTLEAEKFDVTYLPFQQLNERQFRNWIDLVLAEWEFENHI